MSAKTSNKTVLITGASGGIGRVVAKHFAEAKFNTILASTSKKKLLALQTEIKKFPGKSNIIVLDVSDEKAVKRKLAKTRQIDVLINIAGVQGPIGEFVSNDYQKWIDVIRVNLLGTVQVIKAALPKMKRGASIINFSGGGALTPRQNFSSYAVAKTGVVRFTEILAKEVKSHGIRVNAVSPGGVNTDMFKEMLKAGEKRVGTEEWQALTKQKENGGADASSVARLCLWLASEKSQPLTGKTISAVYDDWQKWSRKKIKQIANSDWYTLRRLDPYTITKLRKT